MRQWTGIPVSIGMAPTKTLAKLANRMAKKQASGVFDLGLDADSPAVREALSLFPIEDIWGIGRQWSGRLQTMGVTSALDLRNLPDSWLRAKMGVNGLRIAAELRGIPCHGLEMEAAAKKSCVVSRSFGRTLRDLAPIRAAVATYAARAAQKLRSDGLLTRQIRVSLLTARFAADGSHYSAETYESSLAADLGRWSNDGQLFVSAATRLAEAIFKPDRAYKKAMVFCPLLEPESHITADIFAPVETAQQRRVMAAMDQITSRYGRRSVQFAAEVAAGQRGEKWEMRRDRISPNYTTRIAEAPQLS